MNSFNDLGLSSGILRALETMNYSTPTAIQTQAVPAGLSGRDVVGCAQTGTGKTAAFAIPLITALSNAPGKTALVLAPTRELAAQILGVIEQLAKFQPALGTVLLIG